MHYTFNVNNTLIVGFFRKASMVQTKAIWHDAGELMQPSSAEALHLLFCPCSIPDCYGHKVASYHQHHGIGK